MDSVSPNTGPAGSVVTITGLDFTGQGQNVVFCSEPYQVPLVGGGFAWTVSAIGATATVIKDTVIEAVAPNNTGSDGANFAFLHVVVGGLGCPQVNATSGQLEFGSYQTNDEFTYKFNSGLWMCQYSIDHR